MRVLVTGASGMLGSGVARALSARGDDVTVLQRRPADLTTRQVLGDLTDASVVDTAVTGQDAVVHLAAKVDVAGPETEYRRVNVDGTATLLEAARRHGVTRFVQVSSPSVAHTGRSLVGAPAGPADPQRARGPYARTKAAAELLALAADSEDLAVVAVRPHVVWGPGDPQLVARIVDRARRGRLPVLGSGAALVDSTYVDNAVGALLAALDRAGQVHGEVFVVTNGEPRPISELIAGLATAGGAPAPSRHVPVGVAVAAGAAVDAVWALAGRLRPSHPLGDPPMTRFLAEQLSTAHWFDQRRTRDRLGWRPEVGLEEGFARVRAWYAARA